MKKQPKILLILIVFSFLSCNSDKSGRNSKKVIGSGVETTNAQLKTRDTEEDEEDEEGYPKVELRYIINPEDNTHDAKVTLPKNYNGLLYLGGINIGTLASKHISVRFKFGKSLGTVIIPATIGLAVGTVPQTDSDVLILQMDKRPFKNVRLLYDLFDYNTYDTSEAPTSDALDEKLYCRGLDLEYDPTFASSTTNVECDEDGEVCLYAYAKIVDSGLYPNSASSGAIIPTSPQIDEQDIGYSPTTTLALQKCLPDNNSSTNFYSVIGQTDAFLGIGTTVTLGGNSYIYNGPYRTIAETSWEIKKDSNALFSDTSAGKSPTGLFEKSWSGVSAGNGYRSFLFPRTGKMVLGSGVKYFGSSEVFGVRSLHENVSNGETSYYMDGCNLRVTNYDKISSEGISSCNVTATIELITYDTENNKEVILVSNSELKLQLIRPSVKNHDGDEVYISSFKSCNNSKSCSADECCFYNQCWHDSFISHCPGEVNSTGNLGIGQSCLTDYDCASLCCRTGACAVHLPSGENPIYCSKPLGERCIAEEWCAKVNIYICSIVKTPNGVQSCARRCKNVPTHGLCKNQYCTSPTQPEIPEFDPDNPDCKDAIDPEDWID